MKLAAKILAIGLVLAVLGFVAIGRDRVWVVLAGDPDLGPVEFETLEPPATPNYFLVCPEEVCLEAQSDLRAPTFGLDVRQLQQFARSAWDNEPRLKMVASDTIGHQDRYVQRTPIMRFPDTISVRFVEAEDGKSSLAIYSRSQIGQSDLGVNRERVMQWIELLKQEMTD